MKKIYGYIFVFFMTLFLFECGVKASYTATDNGVSVDQVKTYAKALEDTGDYHSVCAYNYQNGDKFLRYIVAVKNSKKIGTDSDKSLQFISINANGEFDTTLCGVPTAQFFEYNSKNPAKSKYNKYNACVTDYTKFWDECPKINFDKDNVDSNSGYQMSIGTSPKNPVFPNSNTSPIYSYVDKIDLSNQIICDYGAVTLTYDTKKDKVTATLNNNHESVKGGLYNLKSSIKSSYFVKGNDGKYICPNIKCEDYVEPGDVSGYAELRVEYAASGADTKNKFCTLKSVGSSNADITDVDADDYFEINNGTITFPTFDFGTMGQSCKEFFGESGVKLIRTARKAIQYGAIVLTLVLGMVMFIPAIMNKDNEGLSKSLSKFSKLLIILAIILLLPTLVKVIGMIAGFDITCL